MKSDVWLVFTPLAVAVVDCCQSEAQARKAAIKRLGVEHKSYLARDWKIRRPKDDDELRYWASQMDGHRPAEPTVKTAKRKSKRPSERLF